MEHLSVRPGDCDSQPPGLRVNRDDLKTHGGEDLACICINNWKRELTAALDAKDTCVWGKNRIVTGDSTKGKLSCQKGAFELAADLTKPRLSLCIRRGKFA